MTDLLQTNTTDRVLEIGTGSAYQTAVLAELVHTVYTIEIIEPLGQSAGTRLARLGYSNVLATSAMATTAGKNTHRSTQLSSPRLPAMCPHHCSSNCAPGAG
ncbi:MAG: hypothetical protein Ct9H300mP16_04080 [Pseudomonadota bacterium]|nr:MAG: hypothetical protein Ct9H300mP16_04080 [Pseudomonadota bacterium]